MDKVLAFLNGKKTYAVAIAILVCGILDATSVKIPPYAWSSLAALGLGWLRSGVESAKAGK